MKHYLFIFGVSLFLLLGREAYAEESVSEAREQRSSRIGFYHLGLGVGAYGMDNLDFNVLLMAGCGSSRNLINVDFGVGYDFSTVLPKRSFSCIHGHWIPFFISASVNLLRRERNCLYAGAGYSYNVASGALYKGMDEALSDKNLLKSHSDVTLKIGYRWNILDLSLRCRYSLSPKYSQKYIYETEAYDFEATGAQIYNRWQLGFTIIYYFRFGL